MKNKKHTDWLSILLISVFLLNTVLYISLYIDEQTIHNLIFLILYPTCLVIYVSGFVFSKIYKEKSFLIIYNDFFEICGKSILDSKVVCERNNKSYKKYGLSENVEKKNFFSYGGLNIDFGIMNLDQNRKLMIIYKMKALNDSYLEEFYTSIERAKEQYYKNNDIVPMTGDHVFYKNKRNAFKIEELEGKYTIIRYRHQVPIGIYIKHILNYTVGWENIGSLHDEGISYFDSIEQAEEYISYVLM